MSKILKSILLIYVASLHLVIGFFFYRFSNAMIATTNCSEVKQEAKPEIIEEPKIKISTVYILPHPPDFMEGRSLQFNSYKVISEEGKKKVIFSEIVNGRVLQTKVDSEAIKWR